MARALSLNRNAKRAVAALVLVIVAMIALTAWTSVVALTPESTVAEPSAHSEDEIVDIGGHALLLEHGSAANRIVHWLHAGLGNSRAFELGTRTFAAHTATLSPEGLQRVAAIADMMTHVKALDARIFLESGVTEPELEQPRAMQIRGTLIADGVSPARIAVSEDPIRVEESSPRDAEIVVVLTA
jgi:hypothetical protein